MNNIKKAWITEQEHRFVSLSIEAADVDHRICPAEFMFPDRKDTAKKRVTLSLGLLSREDLLKLEHVISSYLRRIGL